MAAGGAGLPKPLHVGRDPGSKGGRVAQTSPFQRCLRRATNRSLVRGIQIFAEACVTPGAAGSSPAGAMEGLPLARYPVSKTGGPPGLGGSTPSPSALGGMAERKGGALLRRRALVRLAGSSPAACASLHRSWWRWEDAGFGAGDRRFESCRPDLARWRNGYLASLMSSRSGFDSRPRYPRGT